MIHTIVIADDVTGANDIGIMYAKSGLNTLVYSQTDRQPDYAPCDVLVIDTDSRFDTRASAYEKVRRAIRQAPKEGVRQYIDKQCSVFRGNIGAEFDAMLDELQEEFAVVVLGFPDNGRTTLHSLHYVYGILLENSQFRRDPVHPMTCSDLREILKSQTSRRVSAIHWEVYEQGKEAVRNALEAERKLGGYCIMDVRDNNDLAFLAELLSEEKVLCGSSALSEYLAKVQHFEKQEETDCHSEQKDSRVFCIAGSLTPQTVGQTQWMRDKDYPVFQLDTRRLIEENEYEAECSRLVELAMKALQTGDFAMVHSMNQPELVEETKKLALDKGIDNTAVSTLVSGALSKIARRVIDGCGIRKIVVCGGDTSAALCAGLEVDGMQVLKEIETGLPTCRSVKPPYYELVLKSGSFGSPEFIEKAVQALTD